MSSPRLLVKLSTPLEKRGKVVAHLAGGPGVGKSTLLKGLEKRVPGPVYKDLDEFYDQAYGQVGEKGDAPQGERSKRVNARARELYQTFLTEHVDDDVVLGGIHTRADPKGGDFYPVDAETVPLRAQLDTSPSVAALRQWARTLPPSWTEPWNVLPWAWPGHYLQNREFQQRYADLGYESMSAADFEKALVKQSQVPEPPKPQTSDPPPAPEPPGTPQLYQDWQATPGPKTMAPLLKSMEPLIGSQLRQYQGTLPEAALRANAKRFAVGAIKGYDPSKGAKLTTHVVNSLRQLHRKNYEAQSTFRLSEELQRAMGTYQNTTRNLEQKLGREPTAQELADELSWPVSKIERLGRQSRQEVTLDDLLFDPTDPNQTPPDPRIDFVYHDLSPTDKLIMEWKTGYGGKKTRSAREIAKKLGVTESAVSQRSLRIAKKLKEAVGI